MDEYQDVNQTQVDIVHALRPGGRGLTVVGDDAQAVYAFRGSDSAHLLDLTTSLPDVTVIRLDHNFRSRQRLLDLANVVRPHAGEQKLMLHSDRTGGRRPRLVRCHDAPAEARSVVDAVLTAAQDGHRLQDQAVLMRTAHHSDLLEIELTARHVPFVKFGGLKFLEAAHVKDFVAAVRLLDNRLDEVAWYRLLRLHDGIGPARARALLELLIAPGDQTDQATEIGHDQAHGIPATAAMGMPKRSRPRRRCPGSRWRRPSTGSPRPAGGDGSVNGRRPAWPCSGRCSPFATRTRWSGSPTSTGWRRPRPMRRISPPTWPN